MTIQSFRESGYEIIDDRFEDTGDVMIWSKDPVVPRLGDRYLIAIGGEVHELAVYTLTTFRGGWSVTCRAET
ncbi:MAG: hypothetical protein ACREE0_02345 [Phenylobacterium sp.]